MKMVGCIGDQKPIYHRRNCPTCGSVMTRYKDELGEKIAWSCLQCGRFEEEYKSGDKLIIRKGQERWLE